MAFLVRPVIQTSRAQITISPSSWAGSVSMVANFASSSRVKLDSSFLLNSGTSSNVSGPSISLASEGDSKLSSSSHQASMTSDETRDTISNKVYQEVPVPQENFTMTASSSIPTPKFSHIPQFNQKASHPHMRSLYEGLRFIPEPVNVDYHAISSNYPSTHTLHIRSTRNNVLLTLTDGLGPLFGSVTGGTDRTFKNAQRSTYEASAQAAVKMFDRIVEWSRHLPNSQKPRLRLAYNGLFGSAKEAVTTTLAGPQGEELRRLITRVEDRTKVKIGGVRARKPRRL
nr:hypothetical protein L203_00804 [Cryptococcus depauperatus CBS 7841]